MDDFAYQCLNQNLSERISLRLTVDLGTATLPLGEALRICQGSKFAVSIPDSEQLALRLAGQPLAYGRIINAENGVYFEVIRSHFEPSGRKELVEALPDEHYQGS